MNRKYTKYRNREKYHDMLKRSEYMHSAINETTICNANYREIFDNAVKYAYDEQINEYHENSIYAIMVNNIRHSYSNYDDVLRGMHSIHRTEYEYIQYKNSVLDKIGYVYPVLKDECDRQKRKCDMVNIIEVG